MTTHDTAAFQHSRDMLPVAGTIEVDIPVDVLWEFFTQARAWPRWNPCFLWVHNERLALGQRLTWCFRPIHPFYPYVMPAVADVVEVEPRRKVTWEVTALPGFHARHSYLVEDAGNGRSRFGSWEQAMGPSFRAMRDFWLAHFTFVKDRSLAGARLLETVYKQHGRLAPELLPRSHPLLREAASPAGAALAFYRAHVRQSAVELGPGVHAVFGGGGNSLVVQGRGESLLVDTKFFPGSYMLRRWIREHVAAPVKTVVNTHYHYDHTRGNALYPRASLVAYHTVPASMHAEDGKYWASHRDGVPVVLVGEEGAELDVGGRKVRVGHPGAAHTHGDLWVHVPDADVVATGDLVFHEHYPFFDLSPTGADIDGLAAAIRRLAAAHPTAAFVPGHGPIARAGDLVRFADYLESLKASVEEVVRRGATADEAVLLVDLSPWDLEKLPVSHRGRLVWTSAESNIRWMYELVESRAQNASPRPAARPARPASASTGPMPSVSSDSSAL
ncbi:MBL fold metallo-hydrolase [Sorangium sp. So ce1335]|uniref:MBL fold metallo-hydrolase n=1 Tax=Sorangium sp. So ce1335 TaxID=3133335 RepID=UPI003F63E405